MFVSLIVGLAGLAATEFPDDPEQYSVWMQQACRIQQVGHSGGEPVDHTEFCACFDTALREAASPAIYRVFALGSQGAVREQGMIEDWEAARDTAAVEAATLPPTDQAQFTSLLQGGLGRCMHLSHQGE